MIKELWRFAMIIGLLFRVNKKGGLEQRGSVSEGVWDKKK
jgi:hypothetical protein